MSLSNMCLTLRGVITNFSGDGTCKHVAALLFGLQSFVQSITDRSEIGVTDQFAKWINPAKSTRPVKITALDTRADPTKEPALKPIPDNYKPIYNVAENGHHSKEKMIYRLLKNESLPACAAYTLSDSSGSEYEFEVFHNNVPDAAKLFLAKDENLSFEGFVQELTQYFNSQVCSEIFETTISQSCSDIWKYQRIGRITASNVFGCLHFTGKNADGSLVKSILGQCTYDMSSVPSINHGKKYESKGRDQYLQSLRSKHNNVHFEPAGLLVCETDPYIGASSDGLIECQCCGKGCIEIKCPYTNADKESKHAASLDTKNFYVQDGAPHLKENISSPYYCQIQCQLALAKRQWCDLVIYTHVDIYIHRVLFCEALWNDMKEQLLSFYKTFIYPKLRD